jgi:hypothetical protein
MRISAKTASAILTDASCKKSSEILVIGIELLSIRPASAGLLKIVGPRISPCGTKGPYLTRYSKE